MPKEYEECVKTEKKKHSEKDAKRICAIAYYKRHGVSVNEAHKRAKKALGDMNMKMIKLARSKEALLLEAKRIAKSTGLSPDDFIVLPLTNELRNHPKMKALEPDVVEPVYRFILVQKSVNGKDFVILQTDGKIRLDFGALPENPMAKEMNQPIRQDVPGEGKVDVEPGESADATTKSMAEKDDAKMKCKGEDCAEDDKEDDKKEKSVLEVDREDPVPNEGVVDVDSEDPKEALVQKALPLLDKLVGGEELQDSELEAVKSFLEVLKATKSLLEEDVKQKSVAADDAGKEEKKGGAKDFLGQIMSKVAKGEELTELESRALGAAVDAVKKESGDTSSRSARDTLSTIMSKVAKGEDLSEEESKILSAAVDAAKKAKSEVTKSLISAVSKIVDVEETPEALYKSMMGMDPIEGMFVFVRKADANRFANKLKTKSLGTGIPYARTVNASEKRRGIPNRYRFIVVFE